MDNNTLFHSILKSFGFNKKSMPSDIDSPLKLSRRLGGAGNTLEKLNILEKYNISFLVTGEMVYESEIKKNINICLELKDDKFSLRCNENRNFSTSFFKEKNKEECISLKFNTQIGTITYYNYKKEYHTIEYSELKDLQKSYHILYCKHDEELEKKLSEFIEMADLLKKETKGFINMYKYRNIPNGSMEIWRMLSKSFVEPEDIDENESFFIDKANHGGHHYSEKYTGEAILLDINSMYLHYMSISKFTFPTRKGDLKTFAQDEFNQLQFFPYGVYRCDIFSKNKLFTSFKNNHYTHFDLNLIKLLDKTVTITLIQDKYPNILFYTRNRVNGHQSFESFKNYMYPLKKRGLPVKPLINSLWGKCCDKNKYKAIATDETPLDIDDFIMENINTSDDNNKTYIEYSKKEKIFHNNYARIGCFLTSFCRLEFMKICMALNSNDIIRINTDSVMLKGNKIPSNIKISEEIGDFKIEKQGHVIYENLHLKPIWTE